MKNKDIPIRGMCNEVVLIKSTYSSHKTSGKTKMVLILPPIGRAVHENLGRAHHVASCAGPALFHPDPGPEQGARKSVLESTSCVIFSYVLSKWDQ
jgi:hypothetical protein